MTETYLHIKPLLINRYLKHFHAMFDLSNDLLEKMNWSELCHDRIRPVSSQLQYFVGYCDVTVLRCGKLL